MASKKKNAIDRIVDECLVARVRLLNRQLTRIYDEALRPLDVKAGQMGILVVVAKRGPVSPGEIGKAMHMEKSTVSRNLDILRRRGWLASLPGEDERSLKMRLTPRGKKLLDRALPHWETAQQKARKLLGEGGADGLHRMVKIN